MACQKTLNEMCMKHPLLVCILLLGFSLPLSAQKKTKISSKEAMIFNLSYMDITIQVSFKENKWERKKMKAEGFLHIQLKNKAKQPLVKISTPGLMPTTVVYRLQGGKKYDILWFGAKKRLDIWEQKD
jgi:hypothetical protein